MKRSRKRSVKEPDPSVGNPKSSKSYFSWTKDLKLNIATYIRDNYEEFKCLPKVIFARKVKEEFGINCSDVKLKNGFSNLIKKYMDIKSKLNSSGFGIDIEKDKTLDKGWVLKQCPYFDVLDEVMSTRPNVSPSKLIQSSGFSAMDDVTNSDNVSNCDVNDILSVELSENESDDSRCEERPKKTRDQGHAFADQGIFQRNWNYETKQREITQKCLGSFFKMMDDKSTKQNDVELIKHDLELKKFEHAQSHHSSKLEIERMRVKTEREIHLKKIETEKELKLMEIQNLKEEREFEIQKLQLQIQLEQVKKST